MDWMTGVLAKAGRPLFFGVFAAEFGVCGTLTEVTVLSAIPNKLNLVLVANNPQIGL